jgi:succinate dehydrogenase / fumarate reductase membrane anchor subunit
MSRQVQGLRPWLWQRVSALYLALFLIYIVVSLIVLDQFDYQQWFAWVVNPVNSIFIYIGFLMLFVHAWIGIKDVIMDYIHPIMIRSLTLMLIGIGLLACLLWLSRTLLVAILT